MELLDQFKGLKEQDGMTLANAVSGAAGIMLALAGVGLAAAYVLFALAFDYLDGKTARKGGKPTEFGKQLDSLADVISFGVAPAIIVFSLSWNALAAICGLFFVCCALVRLARFNVQGEKGVFYGLPSPAAAVVVIVLSLLAHSLGFIWLLLGGIAMTTSIKIMKPKI